MRKGLYGGVGGERGVDRGSLLWQGERGGTLVERRIVPCGQRVSSNNVHQVLRYDLPSLGKAP